MPIDVQFRVTNYKKAAAAVKKIVGKNTYRGYFKDAIQAALIDLTAYAKSITHRITGALAAALTWEYNSVTRKGRLFIDPRFAYLQGASLRSASEYGPYEHARGGEHAFFERTMRERAPYTIIRELNAQVRTFDV